MYNFFEEFDFASLSENYMRTFYFDVSMTSKCKLMEIISILSFDINIAYSGEKLKINVNFFTNFVRYLFKT